MAAGNVLRELSQEHCKTDIPEFRTGDTVKVHTKIVEGNKERIQIFEGVVIKRPKSLSNASATFTVRKVSYNIGVERTFYVHSPRIDKIEVVRKGVVRRARLFYLRERRGKSARIKAQLYSADRQATASDTTTPAVNTETNGTPVESEATTAEAAQGEVKAPAES